MYLSELRGFASRNYSYVRVGLCVIYHIALSRLNIGPSDRERNIEILENNCLFREHRSHTAFALVLALALPCIELDSKKR